MADLKIKLAVDRSRNRVLFADAGSDFVDVLLSFLTLPLSAVALCAGASSSPGCLSCLRASVTQLSDSKLLRGAACHGIPLGPHYRAIRDFLCQWHGRYSCECDCLLTIVMSQASQQQQGHGSDCKCWKVMARVAHVFNQATRTEIFLKGKQRFVIGDDLAIKPASTSSTLSLLQKTGSDLIRHGFEEVEVCVGLAEVVSMLKASISSPTVVFTKTFLSKESDPSPHVTNNQTIVGPKIQHRYDKDPDSSPHFNIKIFYDRHKKRVMYAECDHDFVDLLLSFLTYPVGSLFKNLAGTSHIGCSFDNLYRSALDLDVSGLLTGRCSPKKTLLDPSICPFSDTSVLPVPEWFNMGRIPLWLSPQFCNDAVYVVDDDLLIYQASAIQVMTKHWRKVDQTNVSEMDVAISKQEAVDLLRAALTSKTARAREQAGGTTGDRVFPECRLHSGKFHSPVVRRPSNKSPDSTASMVQVGVGLIT